MKKKKLSQRLVFALAMYYANRGIARSTGRHWNKNADMDRVAAAARKSGFLTDACAGTFWFSRSKAKVYYQVGESTFPNAMVISRTLPKSVNFGATTASQ